MLKAFCLSNYCQLRRLTDYTGSRGHLPCVMKYIFLDNKHKHRLVCDVIHKYLEFLKVCSCNSFYPEDRAHGIEYNYTVDLSTIHSIVQFWRLSRDCSLLTLQLELPWTHFISFLTCDGDKNVSELNSQHVSISILNNWVKRHVLGLTECSSGETL
jgi:hypothetical protein